MEFANQINTEYLNVDEQTLRTKLSTQNEIEVRPFNLILK